MGLIERIDKVFSLDPAKGAIEFKGRWHSWGEMAGVCHAIGSLVAAAQAGEGSVVGMLVRNRVAHLPALIGVLRAKCCLATFNPFQPVERIAAELRELRVPVLIADAEDWKAPALLEAARDIGCLGISLQETEGRADATLVPGLERIGASTHHDPLPGVGILMLSSGTTGTPKRVPLGFRNFERAVLDVAFYEAGAEGGEITLKRSSAFATLPLVHIGGLWTATLNFVMGRSLVLIEKFNVEEFRDAMRRHRPKLVALPPAALRMVFDANVPKEDMSSLIAVRGGSAPLDSGFAEAFLERYGVPILDSYGATEFGGGVAGWTWQDWQKFGKDKRGSVGRANKGCEIRVVDPENGEPLPPGKVGLLEVRAPQVDAKRWSRTTDLAEMDADGFIFIRGRSDGAIIRGGFKILPEKVVDVLREHPAVGDASVVGMPDERLGAVPVAAVELRKDAHVSEEELISHVRAKLVAYQVPTRIKIVEALPRTPSMKVSQPGVRALFAEVANAAS